MAFETLESRYGGGGAQTVKEFFDRRVTGPPAQRPDAGFLSRHRHGLGLEVMNRACERESTTFCPPVTS